MKGVLTKIQFVPTVQALTDDGCVIGEAEGKPITVYAHQFRQLPRILQMISDVTPDQLLEIAKAGTFDVTEK